MTIDSDGRRYGEDDLVQVATGRMRMPYLFIAMDGSALFVARRERVGLSIHRADVAGVAALAISMGWTWLPRALAQVSGSGVDDATT